MGMKENQISEAAAALGRVGGRSTSAAKQSASRLNGAKGGKPKADPMAKLFRREMKARAAALAKANKIN